MIESVEISNFKSIKKKHFHLRNLNLLFGLNGTGKSSLIQALLCLRQSRNLGNGSLSIKDGDYVTLGKAKDVFYQYSTDEYLTLNLKFSDNRQLNYEFKYLPEADYFLDKNWQGQQNVENIDFRLISQTEALFTDNFQYLSAYRARPKHIQPQNYGIVVNQRNIGNQGHYTAHFLEVYGGTAIAFDNMLHTDSNIEDQITQTTIVKRTLLDQVNFWMGEISKGVNIVVTPISSDYVLLEYQYKQRNLGYTNRFKPENVGFGITYGLPIVVALLAAKPGELIIIENPESDIHPRGQAELGKLIALAAMNDVQLIIETHSDHILNGIRVAIKENPRLKDRTLLYYFDKVVTDREQYSKVTNIEIDNKGELSEYPKNLLEEWSNQLLKLL